MSQHKLENVLTSSRWRLACPWNQILPHEHRQKYWVESQTCQPGTSHGVPSRRHHSWIRMAARCSQCPIVGSILYEDPCTAARGCLYDNEMKELGKSSHTM